MRVSASYLERVARDWQHAFEAAHGKPAPSIIWQKGWFVIESTRWRYRRAAIEEMTKTLRKGFTEPPHS
jgi:hypothetical protein